MAASNVRGVSRVLEKLENSVKNGNYYEAHQMYRTLYFRYLAQNKYKEALDMLYNGSLLFLEHDQLISGADLAILLVDVLVKSEEKDYDGWTPKLCKIFSNISTTTPERETFLAQALRWSSNHRSFGHPFLHQCIAQVYWNEKNYFQARHHYIYSKDGQGCAKLLIEFQSTQGFQCEADLFIAQAVFQYLCLSNKITAYQTFTSYTEQHPRIKRSGPPYLLPLLNFIFFLLQAIESRKLPTFVVLCEQYEPSIKRDPCYVGYLDKIGQIFFGLKPPQQKQGGLFGNFFESFLRGLDDSDDEAPQASTSKPPEMLHTELD
ncbi:Golgi to ER traffic protein 4 homolog [Tribolium madens]|uniref:Golgi to ER traffic protein 4 homolog n=1 Tax=Tribolium madens TaxID=41895 RepID=UPI001CF71F23|nr:Golgi to ER traffic protein 4 homolog [Tribolium madens]